MLAGMQWLSTPPCPRMEVKVSDPEHGVLELTGPAFEERVISGAAAAFGAGFTAFALRFLRLPIPPPFKVVPLVLTAAGAGITALGASGATAQHSVRIERGRGISFRWRFGPRGFRTLHLPAEEIEEFEVTTHEVASSNNEFGFSAGSRPSRTVYRLVVVTKDGKAWNLESFGTRAQARLRKERIEEILEPGQPSERKRSAGRASPRTRRSR